jgi:hypothetical protein
MAWRRDPRLLSSAIALGPYHQCKMHTVLLKVLLASSHELDSSELVPVMLLVAASSFKSINIPTSLKSRDDRANESTLNN